YTKSLPRKGRKNTETLRRFQKPPRRPPTSIEPPEILEEVVQSNLQRPGIISWFQSPVRRISRHDGRTPGPGAVYGRLFARALVLRQKRHRKARPSPTEYRHQAHRFKTLPEGLYRAFLCRRI